MAANQENPAQDKTTSNFGNPADASTQAGARSGKIDRTAPAGSENSLGAESVRDGRPNTDDSTVEAIDEEGPGTTVPEKTSR
jgi:hypothetical protein